MSIFFSSQAILLSCCFTNTSFAFFYLTELIFWVFLKLENSLSRCTKIWQNIATQTGYLFLNPYCLMDQKVHTSSLLLSTIVSYNSFFSTLPVNLTTQILRNLTTQSIAIIYACNFQKKACDSGTSPHQPELPKTFPSTRRSQKYSHVLPLNYTEM